MDLSATIDLETVHDLHYDSISNDDSGDYYELSMSDISVISAYGDKSTPKTVRYGLHGLVEADEKLDAVIDELSHELTRRQYGNVDIVDTVYV